MSLKKSQNNHFKLIEKSKKKSRKSKGFIVYYQFLVFGYKMDKKVRTSLLKYAKAHETYLLCQKISQVLIVLGIYNFGPCAENPSSLVFHAAKKR